MAIKSVYRYFRPLMVCCSALGHFPVAQVTGDSAAFLRVKYNSVSTLVFTIVLITNLFRLSKLFLSNLTSILTDINRLSSIANIAIYAPAYAWCFLCTKDIVEAFQAVDQLRETLTLVSTRIRLKLSNPKIWSRLVLATFMISHSLFVTLIVVMLKHFDPLFYIGSIIGGGSPFRQALVLSCLFYSCSLVDEDAAHAWICCRDYYHKPTTYVNNFCQLLITQRNILKRLFDLLARHLLVILAFRICTLYNGVLLYAYLEESQTPYLTQITVWSMLSGLLIYCSCYMSEKYKRVTEEVLVTDLSNKGLTKRDVAKIKLLTTQLQAYSEPVTAAGYVEINPKLFVALLALAVDYLIVLWQYKAFLRSAMGLPV